MKMDLKLKGYSPKTQAAYLGHMKNFTQYFGRSPAKMDEEEIREYLKPGTAVNRISWLGGIAFELTGIDPHLCPCCKKGRMVTREILAPQDHAPPRKVRWVA